MKFVIFALAMAALMLGLTASCIRFFVSPANSSPIYQSDENVPFDSRTTIDEVPPGEPLRVIRCVDNKSDQYLKVSTLRNEVGYLYNLQLRSSIRFTLSDSPGLKYFVACSPLLLRKIG